MTDPFVATATQVLRGGEPPEGYERIETQRPSLVDRSAMRGLTAPVIAAIAWTAAALREATAETTFDPVAMLLRLLALGLSIRAAIVIATAVRRLRLVTRARRHGLVLGPDKLFVRAPDGDVVLAREDVVEVRADQDERETPVYLVTRPSSGRLSVMLPPVFGGTGGQLAERLMRWVGSGGAKRRDRPPLELPSKVYDETAAGRPPPGALAIPQGRRWMLRGPYTTLLCAIVLIESYLRLPREAWTAIAPWVPIAAAALLVAVPAVWLLLNLRHVAPRKGVALVLAPPELLLRTRRGILRVPYKELKHAVVDATPTWSILLGYHRARRLVLDRTEEGPISIDEAFLGVPAEVAQGLVEAYKRGALPETEE